MTTFYAELSNDSEIKTDCFCDLHRFDTKKERDTFVDDHSDCRAISAVDAKKEHSEQLRFWNN